MATACGRIMLHPLCTEEYSSESFEPKSPQDETKRHNLTLHFQLQDKLDFEYFELFGQKLIQALDYNTLGIDGIKFAGMRPSGTASALKHFTRSLKHRRRLYSGTEAASENQNMLTPTSLHAQSPSPSDFELEGLQTASLTVSGVTNERFQNRSLPRRQKRRRNDEPEAGFLTIPEYPPSKHRRSSARLAKKISGEVRATSPTLTRPVHNTKTPAGR